MNFGGYQVEIVDIVKMLYQNGVQLGVVRIHSLT